MINSLASAYGSGFMSPQPRMTVPPPASSAVPHCTDNLCQNVGQLASCRRANLLKTHKYNSGTVIADTVAEARTGGILRKCKSTLLAFAEAHCCSLLSWLEARPPTRPYLRTAPLHLSRKLRSIRPVAMAPPSICRARTTVEMAGEQVSKFCWLVQTHRKLSFWANRTGFSIPQT